MSTALHRVSIAARLLLGFIFVAHGLNGFLNFWPQDFIPLSTTQVPERAATFVAALIATGYVFPLVNAIEIVGGALLLSNRFVPIALAVLAPIIVNLLAFYGLVVAVAPGGIVLAALTLVLEVYLAWTHREAFRPMLAAHASETPSGGHPHAEPHPA
jgi:uncharacterized membrane protein YphA (DoxX/SURF4 family)